MTRTKNTTKAVGEDRRVQRAKGAARRRPGRELIEAVLSAAEERARPVQPFPRPADPGPAVCDPSTISGSWPPATCLPADTGQKVRPVGGSHPLSSPQVNPIPRVPEEELRTRQMTDRLDLEVASGRAQYKHVGRIWPGGKPSLLTRVALALGLKVGGRS